MGNQNCSTPLLPHADFPPVLSRLGVRQRLVNLQLHHGFWSHSQLEPLEIRDATTNLIMFRVPTSLRSKKGSKRLLDMYNAPVATLQLQSQTHSTATFMINASGSDCYQSPVHCRVSVPTTPTVSVSTHASWGHLNTEEPAFVITCEGDWMSHQCDFWLQSALHESRSRIARAHTEGLPNSRKQRRYSVEIAAGVDVALVLLVCAAMDEATMTYFHQTTPSSSLYDPAAHPIERELVSHPLATKGIQIPA